MSLEQLREDVQRCTACGLHEITGPAQALVGRHVKVTQDRGKPLESDLAEVVMVTVHPSAILRQRDQDARQEAYRGLVEDLRALARRVGPRV